MAPDAGALDAVTVEDYRTIIKRHDAKLNREIRSLERFDDYVEGEMPLKYMAPEIEDEYGDRICQLVINMALLAVESYENRLDIDGIRLSPTADADDSETVRWNNMDMAVVSHEVHTESLSLGRSHAQVGLNDNGDPIVTAESPFEMTTEISPMRVTTSAVKRWIADDGKTRMRSLLLPDETLIWAMSKGKWQLLPGDEGLIDHGLGKVPVFTFLNRARLRRGHGERLRPGSGLPQFHPIIPLYEALNKQATDMMVGGEAHALPRRRAVGLSKEDFEDDDGNPISPLKSIAGALWVVPGKPGEVELGEFAASDLRNFHETIKLLLQVGGHLLGLPSAYTAFATDNPAAEGAIKAGEIQLIKGAERKQKFWDSPWRGTWQMVMELAGVGAEAGELSMMWRDAATPTFAQMADGVTKLVSTKDQSGRSVVPVDMARQKLGFTASERDAMAQMDREAAAMGVQAIRDTFTDSVVPGAQ